MGAQSKPTLPPWGYAVAGATGAVLANAVVYPLDIVKTKLQVQVKRKPTANGHANGTANGTTNGHASSDEKTSSDEASEATAGTLTSPAASDEEEHYTSTLHALQAIFSKTGVAGLYSGMLGSLLGVASTNFAYFYWYTFVRSWYLRRTKASTLSTASELCLGAIAGALAQLFTIPVAVVTTRQQTRPLGAPHVGLLDTAKEVIAEDGISGLWRGLKASLVLVVNPAITYGSYQRFKDLLFPGKTRLSAGESFLLGALSKMCATCATQPLIVAKVGLQSKPPPVRKGKAFKSFGEVMRFIIENEGPLGLFKGIGPQILKGLIVQGLLMMTKERLELSFVLMFQGIRKMQQRKIAERAKLLVEQTAREVVSKA